MRRILALLLIALFAAPIAAQAQTFASPGSPTILWNSSSQTAVNSNAEVSLFQYVIPAAYIATGTITPGGSVPLTYTSNATTTGSNTGRAPQPLHFRALGVLAGGAGTTVNVGINLQGTGASLTLNNNIVGAIAGPGNPVRLDVYIVPVATTTATPTSGNVTMFLMARMAYVNAGGTETVVNSSTQASMNTASASILNVVGRWGAAASGSSLTFFNRILRIGE